MKKWNKRILERWQKKGERMKKWNKRILER